PPAASPSVTPRAWRSGGSAPSRTGRTPALRLPHEGYTLLGNGSRAVAVVARSSWLLFPLHAWRFAPRGAFLAHPEGFASSSSGSARDPAGGNSIGPAHYTASSMVAWTPRSSAARSGEPGRTARSDDSGTGGCSDPGPPSVSGACPAACLTAEDPCGV